MTDLEVYLLLKSMDNGFIASEKEHYKLSTVKSIQWDSIDYLPKCIGYLSSLESLKIRSTSLDDISVLAKLPTLHSLSLQCTKVDDISAISVLRTLHNLELRSTKITNVNALCELMSLRVLDLSYNYYLSDISALSNLTWLTKLRLKYTAIEDTNDLGGLIRLIELDLYGTQLNDISALSKLHALRRLDLRFSRILSIPIELLDLPLDFIDEEHPSREGIYIYSMSLIKEDISILKQNRKLIRAYYLEKEKVSINECKVIFLGDAESGKTYSIKRLMNHGEYISDFKESSTPGIEITISSDKLSNLDIRVNYWDFGGQEIQHEMHRMFLTERTAYVVFLNARQDNTINKSARYWLENIVTFVPDAPVLLVINKLDMNANVELEEGKLVEEYGNNVKKIVKMSALKDTPEVFLKNLEGNIIDMITEMPAVKKKVPKAWKALIDYIRNMAEPYLTRKQFKDLCLNHNIDDYENIHDDLVQLFQDIGISFSYRKDLSVADYMLLNPKWLVNAIYTIISNSKLIAHNGVITQKNIFIVLRENELGGVCVKRTIQDISYEGIEINYILGVTRMFRFSHRMKNGSEFFPMLCNKSEIISANEVVSKNALHFIYHYDYLPSNIMHRLIVDMERDLEYRYVWYSGAVFKNKERKQTAYINSQGNEINIYVDGKDSIYNTNEYLMQFRDCLRVINEEMKLQPKEYVTYTVSGFEDRFSYRGLIGSLHKGNFHVYSEIADDNVEIKEILARYDQVFSHQERQLVNSIIKALEKLQNNCKYYSASEDDRNTFIRDILDGSIYTCKDQTLGGRSSTGKSYGKLDIRIEDKDGNLLTIYEGLNLKRFDKKMRGYLSEHISRLIDKYNSSGLKYLFLVSYTDWKKEKFKEYLLNYIEHIKSDSGNKFRPYGGINNIKSDGFLRCMKLSYNCGGIMVSIYHVVVRVAD